MTIKQLDRLLGILERFATVAERWADVEYPVRDETEATFSRVGEVPEPETRGEYDALEVGRFESKIRSAG